MSLAVLYSLMDERETARQVNSGAIQILRVVRRVDREAGLTAARLSALSVLVFAGPCSMGQLAHAEDVAGPTMTRLVDALETAGLVKRRVRAGPGRPIEVSATAKGDRLMRRAADRRLDAIVAGLQQLRPADQRQLAAAAPVLDRLAGRLREG
jgi:DNA-binding MarR family transcriptional regulator